MKNSWKVLAGTAAAAAVVAAAGGSQALATGDFGPDTCLQGYVWRDAFANDHVCVTVATRSQAAADNAAAASRRSPNGGAFGPDTCLQGFVWRQAIPADHVCVTVATRSQAAADNAAGASRRDALNMTLSKYSPNTTTCNGDTCTTTSDDAPRWKVTVNQINLGHPTLRLFRSSDGHALQSWSVTSSAVAGQPGGRVAFQTGKLVCPGATNAYFRIQDPSSGRWSAPRYIRTGCATL